MGLSGKTIKKTLDEVRREGLDALCERLGKADAIRFLQQFETGSGDHVRDRRPWVEHTILEEIQRLTAGQGTGESHYARLRAFPPQAVLGPCFSMGSEGKAFSIFALLRLRRLPPPWPEQRGEVGRPR